jgi:hypothetical protein
MTAKRALLIGIDDYKFFWPLEGCANDAEALAPLLRWHADEEPNFECRVRVEPGTVDRGQFLHDVKALLEPDADVALLYFAGHGRSDGTDVTLCTWDATDATPGLRLSELLGYVQASPVREVILILDCCYAGGAGSFPLSGGNVSVLRDGLAILAASRGDQTAAETPDGRGLFSSCLCEALQGGAADLLGRVTVAGLYSYLDRSFGAFGQRPVFKANLARLREIRECGPAVPRTSLRTLHDLFAPPAFDLPLDPSYEPDAEPHDAEHERVFGILQACRAVHLVEPVGTPHLYFAAMVGMSCRLTPLGRHIWRMADQKRL